MSRGPRLFSDAAAVRALAHRVSADHPAWRTRTVQAVERDRTIGLPIYGQGGPKLQPGFPWGALPRGPGGDLLHAVRPHRFAFAPRWALAALYGEAVADDFQAILEDWMRFAASARNERAYVSNLVVVQRVVALSWAWAFLAARPAEAVRDAGVLERRVLQILASDLCFLAPRLGSSYPNNHLLLDRFGKWFCACVWPEFMPTPSLERDEELWLAELQRQTLADGTGFEHSAHYHEFACEMAVLYLRLCQTNDRQAPKAALERVRAMLRFQVDLGGPECKPIAFGNGVEDPLLPLDPTEGWGNAALREIYRAWSDPGLTQAPADDPAIERAFWLLGGRLAEVPRGSHTPTRAAVYACGGIVVLPNSDFGSRLTLRAGPAPGTEVCGGHTHADLLSIYLTLSSTRLIVDAGTYTYRAGGPAWANGTPAWRRYFAGPWAHNGPVVGAADPLGRLTGDFRSSTFSARARLLQEHLDGRLRWAEAQIESAGVYTGCRRGVIHVYDEYWLVYDLLPDSLQGGGVSFGLQFAPEARVNIWSASRFSVLMGSASLDIALSSGLERARVLEGHTDPPGGWVSPAYGCMQAAPQLRAQSSRASRITGFVLKPMAAADPGLALESGSFEGGYGLRVTHGDYVDSFLLSLEPSAPSWRAWDIEFSGALAWVRQANGAITDCAWIEGRTLDCAGMLLSARCRRGTQSSG